MVEGAPGAAAGQFATRRTFGPCIIQETSIIKLGRRGLHSSRLSWSILALPRGAKLGVLAAIKSIHWTCTGAIMIAALVAPSVRIRLLNILLDQVGAGSEAGTAGDGMMRPVVQSSLDHYNIPCLPPPSCNLPSSPP